MNSIPRLTRAFFFFAAGRRPFFLAADPEALRRVVLRAGLEEPLLDLELVLRVAIVWSVLSGGSHHRLLNAINLS